MTGKPVLVILGPTAVGKTHLAISLAEQLSGEILSADSRQIYRYMNIGTAKATPEEQARIPHHLIDIVEPDENLTLAEYQERAMNTIEAIHNRSRLPIIAGGTGLYITAVIEGWAIPRVPPDHDLRTELEAYARTAGTEALHTCLATLDPEYAARIHPNNVRRVVRALEVCLATGDTMTNQQRKRPPGWHLYMIGLQMPRDMLYARADARVDDMIARGFIQEVRQLLNRGYDRKLPSMSGLGYLEIAAHLLDDLPLEEAVKRTKHNTHDFIRRQDIWFRGHDPGILWHNVHKLDTAKLIHSLHDWLEKVD